MLNQSGVGDATGPKGLDVSTKSIGTRDIRTQVSDSATQENPISNSSPKNGDEPAQESKSLLYLKVGYFITLASASVIAGFSFTVNRAKKESKQTIHEEGFALARRALLRGSIYSISGFLVFCTATYQLFGKKMIADFNAKSKKNDDEDLKYLAQLLK